MQINGRLLQPMMSYGSKKGVMQFEVDDISEVIRQYDELKDKPLSIITKVFRKPRTLNMNAYFWVLADEVAKKLRVTSEEVHKRYVYDHAFVWKDEDDKPCCIAIVKDVDVEKKLPRYWKAYGEPQGRLIQYIRVKGTSECDVEEMSIILDDLIDEANGLGIQTATPEEVEKMKALSIKEFENGKSILQEDKKCYVCGYTYALHKHHIFGASARPKSEKYGLTVWLCPHHHNMSDEGVHFNKELDMHLKRRAQKLYEHSIGSREEFIKEFIRSYL